MAAAEVSLERERATVDYDPGVLTAARLLEAIRASVVLPGLRRALEGAAEIRKEKTWPHRRGSP